MNRTADTAPAGLVDIPSWRWLASALLVPTVLALLIWVAAGYGYLLAHTLAEIFSILVAITALVVASTARDFTRNHYVIVVSVALGWCAGLDLIHTLVFKGMQLIDSDSTNPSAQLWIAARFMQALAMVAAPFMLTRVIRIAWLHALFGTAAVLFLVAIAGGYFPDAFIDGQGLTPFKIYTEYLIIALLGLSLRLLWQRRDLATPRLLLAITVAVLAMMASEFAFTRYASVVAASNLLGHVLKVYAYWFVYLALVQTTLKEPFSMLARAASSFDAVPDPALIVTKDGLIRQANHAAAVRANRPVEDLAGQSVHALFHDPATPEASCEVCGRLAQGQQRFLQLLELPRFQFVECSVAPYAHNGGEQAYVEVVRDISEQHAAEERFRKLFEDTLQPILLVEDGRFSAVNRAALAMLRMDRLEQLLGRSPDEISPQRQPDGRLSRDGVMDVVAIAFAQGSHAFEWEHLRADGEPVTVRVLLTPIRMQGKDILHVVWTDITQQKKAEKELGDYRHTLEQRVAERTADLEALTRSLRSASDEQQAVFDAATVGIILTRDRKILRCNQTMERLFGYPPEALVGLTTRVLYPDDAIYADVSQRLVSDLAGQGFFQEERELLRQDGSRFWCRKMVRAIDRSDPGKGFAGTFEDISSEREAIAEMARARAMAEDTARTKAEFLANMSHEIRTPMNSVIGMTLLALKQETSPKVRDYLEKIQSSSQHLLGVINDILDFSKLDANKMVLEQADFVLEEVLGAVNTVFAEKIASKGLELVVRLAPGVPANLVGDALRIEQVLINLVSNAVKFTEHGQINLQVGVEEQLDDAVTLRFAVQDTGIGLTPAQQQQLFHSFQQADTSITRKYGGSGLGLVISQRLVALMGGQIGVESVPGEGSTFWFTARLGIGSEPASALRMHPDLHGLRMLVVDDNALARQVIAEMLGSMGFDVTSVATGQLALDAIERAEADGVSYDLVFLDWKMPQMDGIAVAREIQRKGLKRPPMLLMITAFDRDSVQLDAVQVGIREVLVKPVTPSVVFNAVMRQFGKDGAELRQAALPFRDLLVETAALAGARALLVEDNPLNQEVATEFLRALGLVVELASDGADALEKVQQGRYDVVLMDMQMPVMDGITATHEIRKLPACASLPIIAMTANAQASDRERCLAAGMNDHIAKPIDPDDLVHKLTQWVKPVPRQTPLQPKLALTHAANRLSLNLHGIAGLDAALGLKLAMGRESLYRGLLEKFIAGAHDFPARMTEALAGQRWDEAERLAHTLKGVAAQIGAGPLREQAQTLEQAIRQRDSMALLEPMRREIADRLAALIDALNTCLPKAEAPAAVTVDPAQWRDLRERLMALLRFDDAASAFVFEENQPLLRAALGERYALLAKAIGDFEFAQALDVLADAA